MKFEAVDTEELKNLEISVDGTQGIYKIGEGEANHYQIPNDKKLIGAWVYTQFFCFDAGANVLGLTTSGALKTTVGGWNM